MKLSASWMLLTLAITIAGCQAGGDRPAKGTYTCVVTPANLVARELVDDTGPAGEA